MILTCKNCKHYNDFGEVIEEGQEPCWSCLKARDYLPNHEPTQSNASNALTNADRIRAMSDEEIAEWMTKTEADIFEGCGYKLGKDVIENNTQVNLSWLKKEVDEC